MWYHCQRIVISYVKSQCDINSDIFDIIVWYHSPSVISQSAYILCCSLYHIWLGYHYLWLLYDITWCDITLAVTQGSRCLFLYDLSRFQMEASRSSLLLVRWLSESRWHPFKSESPMLTLRVSSANRVTIISDFFISIDYTRLFTIMHDYLRLFHCENPNDYSTLLHYLQKDDYSTYCTMIISLIFSGTYFCDYCDYSTIMCIIFIANCYIYYLFELYYCDYIFQSQLYALCTLSLDYVHYLFFVLLYELYFSNAFIRIILFPTHYMHYTIFGHWNNCYNMYN